MASDEQEITLSDLFATLWERKVTVGGVTLLCMLLGVLVTWLPAPKYEAYSVLLFPAGGAGASSLLGLAQSLGISVPTGGAAPLKMYRAVLESERLRTEISAQTGITSRDLKRMTNVRDDQAASMITLSVTHKDPQVARKVAALYVTALGELNRELNLPVVRNQVEFLEKELALRTKQLREAEGGLLQLQQNMVKSGGAPSGVLSPSIAGTLSPLRGMSTSSSGADTSYLQQLNTVQTQLAQVKQQIEAARRVANQLAQSPADLPADLPPAANWRAKLADLEYELRVEELTYGPDAPGVVRLRKQIELTREQLRREIDNYLRAVKLNAEPNLAPLELQRVGLEAQANALRRLASRAPSDTIQLQRMVREVATLNEIVQQLRVALEQARMEMSRDPNRWEVLESGTLKEEPVNKRWKLNIALGLTGGFMLGCLSALVGTRPRPQSA